MKRQFVLNTHKSFIFSVIYWFLTSDGEVKRSEPAKLSSQLYRKKVHYSKLLKTVYAVTI